MGSSLHYFSYCYPLHVIDTFSGIMLAQQILLGATHIRHIFVAGRAGDVLKHLKNLLFSLILIIAMLSRSKFLFIECFSINSNFLSDI